MQLNYKTLSHVIFILLCLLLLYFGIFRFFIHLNSVKNFCEYVKSNDLNSHDIIKKISDEGLSFVENKQDNSMMIYDKKTLGKATCHIDNHNNKRVIVYQGYD